MRVCPKCKEKAVSELKLVLQQLGVPGCICTCNACDEWVSYQESHGFFTGFLIPELLFAFCLVLSLVFFFNIWVGLAAFIALRLGRFYFITRGGLELPNEKI